MTRYWYKITFLFLFISLLFASCSVLDSSLGSDHQGTPVPYNPAWDAAVISAFQQGVQGREDAIAFMVFDVNVDRLTFSEDGTLALLWLNLADRDTGELIPAEAGLAIAERTQGDGTHPEDWKVTLQADRSWNKTLKKVPDEVLLPDLKDRYVSKEQPQQKGKVYTGYKLPYPSGVKMKLSGSIGHVFTYKTCPDSCLYAFDFADGTNFPVLAAKGGRVKYAVWRYPNNYHESANYIVLEDTSTTPTTYQVYYHLAYDSIPADLRVKGASVAQGELLGYADNTGPSSGSHLHFMVHTNAYAYWGTSVDVVFDEVTVNGGRPRTCLEASNYPGYGSQCTTGNIYYSQNNGDKAAPTGGISSPAANAVIKTQMLTVEGFGKDDTGVASMQLYISTDGNWRAAGNPQTITPFSTQLDLCKENVPLGPFMIGLQVVDYANKTAAKLQGTRLLEMAYDCTPPTPTPTITPTPVVCYPDDNQVAIYPEANFTGNCVTLDKGDYAALEGINPLGNNKVESVKVGANLMVLAYDTLGFGGNRLVLMDSASDLAGQTGAVDWLKSFKVIDRIDPPQEPELISPSETLGRSLTVEDKIELSWIETVGADEYSAQLQGPNGFAKIMDWQTGLTWQVGTLSSGEYRWTLTARNLAGISQKSINFNVYQAVHLPVTTMDALPAISQSTAIKLTWKAEKGSANILNFEMEYARDGGSWVSWGKAIPAEDKQLWFVGEFGHSYAFRMRAVDTGGNKEPFADTAQAFVQIASDCTPDSYENPDPGDDDLQGATPLEIGQAQQHNLCGYSDYDWYVFPASMGGTYKITTSSLDGYSAAAFQLYDPIGDVILGDASPETYGSEANFEWKAEEDGLYILRVRPLDTKLAGSNVNYEIKVDKVVQITPANLTCTALLLPAVWFAVKLFTKARNRIREQMNE